MPEEMTVLQTSELDCGYDSYLLLRNLNLNLSSGETLGVLGPNGGGKSTLLRTLAQILPPRRGEITYFEDPQLSTSPRQLAKRMAYLPQIMSIPQGFSLREITAMGRFPHRSPWQRWSSEEEEKLRSSLAQVGLEKWADRKATQLSGGEKKRLLLAQVLIQDPQLLLLDEPLAHLDLRYRWELAQILKEIYERQATLVITFHELDLAAYLSTRLLLLLEEGEHLLGPPRQILTRENIHRAFGIDAEIDFSTSVPVLHYRGIEKS